MPSLQQLRERGPAGVAHLLRLRPEVMADPTPASLAEVHARLSHPAMLTLALMRLDLPSLQAAEALAALGAEARRFTLERLLGIKDDATRAALDRCLDTLAERALLIDGACRLDATLEAAWPQPLGLGISAADVVPQLTADQLGRSLTAWGVRKPSPPRKAELVTAVLGVLNDGERIRATVSGAPDDVVANVQEAAFLGTRYEIPWSRHGVDRWLVWAQDRLLLVRQAGGWLEMPSEVALALRGPGWTPPFAPVRPEPARRRVPPERVVAAASAAGAQAIRVIADTLRTLDRSPITLLKDGRVGAREIRRVAKALAEPPERIRLVVALTEHAGLLVGEAGMLRPGPEGSAWTELEPDRQLAILVDAWAGLPDIPTDTDDLAWAPGRARGVVVARRALLGLLAEDEGTAIVSDDDLVAAVAWIAPLPLGHPLGDQIPDDDPTADDEDDARRALVALLAEAAWLGVVADGALTPAGAALLAGSGVTEVEAALAGMLGAKEDTVVLQGDLTATVLGHPSAKLTTALDRMADRESRSAATTWRFSPGSVRRALDAGSDAEELVADLARLGRGDVPQALDYLIRDVARRHGRLRAGSAVSYLRSDDAALLAEVAADRRLRKHGLRLLAPTVLVSSAAVDVLVAALRAAGHGPVEEGPDGEPVLVREPAPAGGASARRPRPAPSVTDPDDLAKALLARPDVPLRLIDIGDTYVDSRSLGRAAPDLFS